MPVDSLPALREALKSLAGPDHVAETAARTRQSHLTKPPGSLGRLEDIAVHLAAWQGRHPPRLDRIVIAVFAGNHGIAAQGVSAYPASVTAQMVANFRRGGAAINQLAKQAGATLEVVDLDLDRPTADSSVEPALSEPEFLEAFQRGAAVVDPELDLLAVGEMGIGNTTPAAMLAHAILGGEAPHWVGRGTGVHGAALERKVHLVAQAVSMHRRASHEPLALARRLGGRELAAMAGAVFQARQFNVPCLLDGYVATAAVLPLAAVAGKTSTEAAISGPLAHCLAAHVSAEPGHGRLLSRLGFKPLLDLDMRLGEASGAAVAIPLLRAAVACHQGMATFAEAAVDDAIKAEAP